MKVVIIEDERLSAEHLALMLQKIDSRIEVIAYLETVREATKFFSEGLSADLLFIDIHLADGNSFEIFSHTIIDTPIIFTTAYNQYAIQAFKQNSIDYLLKPVTLTEVKFALDKFNKQLRLSSNQLTEKLNQVYSNINHSFKSRFLVKKGQTIDYVSTEVIAYFQTRESISFLVTTKGFRYPVNYTLEQIENLISPKEFFRINRKMIIRINTIEKVDNYLNGRLKITGKQLLEEEGIISRERVNDFKKWLDK